METYRIAWNAAGRPDLRESQLLVQGFDVAQHENDVAPLNQAQATEWNASLGSTFDGVHATGLYRWPLPSVVDELLAGYVANEYATMQALVRQP